jgi:hypothetical protein
MDERLAALIEAAENGRECPPVSILAGSQLIHRYPDLLEGFPGSQLLGNSRTQALGPYSTH